MHKRLLDRQSVCLRQLGSGRAGEVRFGRFLANRRVLVKGLIEGVCAGIGSRAARRHVLAIQDSSELNFQSHAGRVRGLGTVGNGRDLGFFLHPVLAVDADDGACLGLAHLHLWQRHQGKAANCRDVPIEKKESHRWIEAAQNAGQRLSLSSRVTVVADREADIHELWHRLPDSRTDLLIRASRDRGLITDSEQKLFAWIAAQPVRGSSRLMLPAVAGRRSAHEARLQVRFEPVVLKKPRHCPDPQAPESRALHIIEVIEGADTVVGSEAPVHWRLLTTHAVTTLEQARQCIDWYCQRWRIEQMFRTLKRQGLNLESSLVGEAGRLEKLAVPAASAAVRTMQLTLARAGKTARPATDAFDQKEVEVLRHLQPTLEGKTGKQRNPHPLESLAWAAWIIARLGGWKGYACERKPGPITMLHGLKGFSSIHQGWSIARSENRKDVCIR